MERSERVWCYQDATHWRRPAGPGTGGGKFEGDGGFPTVALVREIACYHTGIFTHQTDVHNSTPDDD
jgi:hypothetical protein